MLGSRPRRYGTSYVIGSSASASVSQLSRRNRRDLTRIIFEPAHSSPRSYQVQFSKYVLLFAHRAAILVLSRNLLMARASLTAMSICQQPWSYWDHSSRRTCLYITNPNQTCTWYRAERRRTPSREHRHQSDAAKRLAAETPRLKTSPYCRRRTTQARSQLSLYLALSSDASATFLQIRETSTQKKHSMDNGNPLSYNRQNLPQFANLRAMLLLSPAMNTTSSTAELLEELVVSRLALGS